MHVYTRECSVHGPTPGCGEGAWASGRLRRRCMGNQRDEVQLRGQAEGCGTGACNNCHMHAVDACMTHTGHNPEYADAPQHRLQPTGHPPEHADTPERKSQVTGHNPEHKSPA
eukprot:363643-Chlamydomonas_euryale.AAC.6